MRNFSLVLFFVILIGCTSPNTAFELNSINTAEVSTSSYTATFAWTPTSTETLTPSPTFTQIPTITPLPTKFSDGRLNCPGSIALMYHHIHETADKNTDYLEIGDDIGSFETVIRYLLGNGFYFPTPEEFANDLKTGVCRSKYAIVTIDDSWNDPEAMGVTELLIKLGGGIGTPGTPKVWFAVITRQLSPFINKAGETIDPWEHLLDLQNRNLVYVISHTQTHRTLIDPYDPSNKVNRKIYRIIGDEVLPSRKDILRFMKQEPFFFVYPGGIIADPIISQLGPSGYVGAFTVWPGGLNGAFPYYLPRINGGSRCGSYGVDNSFCVIEQIEKYSGK